MVVADSEGDVDVDVDWDVDCHGVVFADNIGAAFAVGTETRNRDRKKIALPPLRIVVR